MRQTHFKYPFFAKNTPPAGCGELTKYVETVAVQCIHMARADLSRILSIPSPRPCSLTWRP